MFSSQVSPIVIDFGTTSVKALQVSGGDKPSLVAAVEIEIPDAVRLDAAKRMEFLSTELPKAVRRTRFRGRRVAFSIPAIRTYSTHLAVPAAGGVSPEDYIGMQLHAQTGLPPANLVIRTAQVKETYRDGVMHQETICFAVPREYVMQHIEMLRRAKLEVMDVYTEQHAMVWAFKHIHRREGDERITNLFVDLGWGVTKVGISHGRDLVFARNIQVGGRHFDEQIAQHLQCDLASARAHRLATAESLVSASRRSAAAIAAPTKGDAGSGGAVAVAPERRAGTLPASLHATDGLTDAHDAIAPLGANIDDLIESIVDELRMCVRYHRALFENRPIDRVIFVGGESSNAALCRMIAAELGVPGLVGDPIARLNLDEGGEGCPLRKGRAAPGWTVACGLWSGIGS